MKKQTGRGIKLPTHIITSGILLLIQIAFIYFTLHNFTEKSAVAYSATVIAGIIAVIIIINRRGNPDRKIGWIVFILVFPIFGICLFALWGGGRVPPHIKKRMKRYEKIYSRYLKEEEGIHDRLHYYDITHSRQADYLTRESGFPLYGGTSSRFLASGEEYLKVLLEELAKAEKYIFIEFFIIAEGVMWDEIHEILKKKKAAGVEIKIIFDDFGSIRRQHKGFIKRLREEGIEVCAFNPINPVMNIFMNNRNHRKIVVIDGKVGFTGGVNIGDEYINAEERCGHWVDSGILIEGSAVTSFVVMFATMWSFVNKTILNLKNYIADYNTQNDGFILPYCDGPLNTQNTAEGIYMQIINTAQHYVYITTPYLIIDSTMMELLQLAAKSGVDVRIVTPFVPDKWYVHPVTRYHYLELLESGVKIYEYTKGFVHSKLFVSDDLVATVGSVNMDYRSFVFHFECGAWLCDSPSVRGVKENITDIIEKSHEITIDEWKKRPLMQKLKEQILHIFGPLM